MDFSLSEEQQMLLDMFRDFAAQEVAPLAESVDRTERAPVETLRKAAALDLLGLALPEAFGGMNAGMIAHGLLLEELGKACLSTAVFLNAHCTTAVLVAACGDTQQKIAWLPGLAKGERLACWASAEPDAGVDLAAITTSVHTNSAGFVVNGRKSFVINADVADLIVVLARSASGNPALVAVEKSTPGLTIGWRNRQMGLRGAAGCAVILDDCRVAPSAWLGGEGTDCTEAMQRAWQFSRLGLAFASLGIAERALADSLEFARNRQQFGGPLANKQAIQSYLGDMATQVETLRRLAQYTAWAADENKATERDVAMLKLWAGNVAVWVVNKAVQIHGGMGYVKSFHIERLHRDARAMTILDGPSETQRITVAAEMVRALDGTVTA
jgi:alkylation response protein AidB-like acyl-CoA dehydrogenase